jgi:hypothetical protein
MNTLLATVVTSTLAAGALAVTVPGTAGAATCSTNWGSQAKAASNLSHGTLTAVRAGRHECFDRLVLDVSRSGLGYSVKYVKAVHNQGQGAVIALKGGAFLEIIDQSQVTRKLPMPGVSSFTTFRQVADGGSFEGYTTIGLGVRARLPFRVLSSGNHLIVDVAHRW